MIYVLERLLSGDVELVKVFMFLVFMLKFRVFVNILSVKMSLSVIM